MVEVAQTAVALRYGARPSLWKSIGVYAIEVFRQSNHYVLCTKICDYIRESTHGPLGHQWVGIGGVRLGVPVNKLIPGTRGLSAVGEVDQGA